MINSDKYCNIFYGDGTCSVEGSEVSAITMYYSGDAIVETKFTNEMVIIQNDIKILVVSLMGTPLTTLFAYSGTLKIKSAEAANIEGSVNVILNRIDNYSELINTKSEDLTIESEKLVKRSASVGRQVRSIKYPILKNQKTENQDGRLYLANGQQYHGNFHVHTKNGSAMTGGTHTPKSQLLYTKPTINGKFINKLVPTISVEAAKIIRAERGKMRSNRSIKRLKVDLKRKKRNL